MGPRGATFKRRVDPDAGSARALGALSIDVKRASLAFDDLGTDDYLFHAIEARQLLTDAGLSHELRGDD